MLKDDQKQMKKEVDKLPKANRKDEMKRRKELLDVRQQNQVCLPLTFPPISTMVCSTCSDDHYYLNMSLLNSNKFIAHALEFMN